MIVAMFQPEQRAVEFDIPSAPSAGEHGAVLAVIFAIGFIFLTLIALLSVRGLYFEREHPVLSFLSLLITLATATIYLAVAFLLIYPHRHGGAIWFPDHYKLNNLINVALGVGWYLASYAWLCFTMRRFTTRFMKH